VHKLDKLYEGVPIYVISTGPSLRGFDFHRLDGRLTIGVNRVIEHYHPSIVHLVDVRAQKTHAAALSRYNGMIVAGPGCGATATHANVFEIHRNLDTFELVDGRSSKSTKIGRSFSDGFFGGGAGCTALHAAILLGGSPIYLLGYDHYEENGRHFDELDPSKNASPPDGFGYDETLEGLELISRESWIPPIYNCNPRSLVRCFPFIDLDAALECGDTPLRSFGG